MPAWKTEFEDAAVVLIGKFNPAIFQPAWLGANNLIRKEEDEGANIEVVNPQVTSFSADWLRVQVVAERFQAVTEDTAHYQALRDLVVSTFHLLEHTPFWLMGLTRDMHFKARDQEHWHKLGHILAPKESWHPILDQPGLRSLTIQSSPLKVGNLQVIRNVKVEPSYRLAPTPGLYIQLNIEASLPNGAQADILVQQRTARELMQYLADSWSEMLSESQKVAEHLLSQA